MPQALPAVANGGARNDELQNFSGRYPDPSSSPANWAGPINTFRDPACSVCRAARGAGI